MKYKKSIGEISFDIFNYLLLTLVLLIALYPMWYVIVSSLSEGVLFMAHRGPLFKPLGLDLTNYRYVFNNPRIATGYKNTLIVVAVGTFLNVTVTSLGAYVLSRKNVLWKNYLMVIIVITMFFSGGLIPLYIVVKNLGLVNKLWALMLPNLVSTYNLIVMRTYFNSIPDEIEESARIDGANHFTILFRLFIPLSLPVIAVMILWYGVGHWNAWFHAYIFINKGELFPLQLILRQILIKGSVLQAAVGSNVGEENKSQIEETMKYAVIVVATVPVLLIYPFLQKYFVKGIMIGAIKG